MAFQHLRPLPPIQVPTFAAILNVANMEHLCFAAIMLSELWVTVIQLLFINATISVFLITERCWSSGTNNILNNNNNAERRNQRKKGKFLNNQTQKNRQTHFFPRWTGSTSHIHMSKQERTKTKKENRTETTVRQRLA